jgi:predicted flap endonuclease-1-like 5' DNA nuclease
MSTFAAVVLGLVIGWIIEWIVDWIYWRGRVTRWLKEETLLRERLKVAETRNAGFEHQVAIQKINITSLQEKLAGAETELHSRKAGARSGEIAVLVKNSSPEALAEEFSPAPFEPARSEPLVRDDLVVIHGIGPVIAGRLNQAGVYTFANLAALTPERLRELVGDVISRLADEQSIIEQARALAEKNRTG